MFERTDYVRNPHDHPIEVCFEPWAMEYTLPARKALRVLTRSEEPGELEIVQTDTSIVVYAFPTCTMVIYLDDHVVEELSIPVPDLPEGISMKRFMKSLFFKSSDH